jgi:DNA-binding transcriptional LysR family regulator
MDTKDLGTFCLVARLGSLAAAARAEATEPSTVSRKIASLEAQLGTRLFQRTTRTLALTEAGAIFLARIEPILTDLITAQDAMLAAIEKPSGILRVTASNAYGEAVIAPLLPSFCRDYPAVEVDLLLTDNLVDLVSSQVDVAIRLGPRPSGDIIITKLKPTERRLVASADYLRSAPKLVDPKGLTDHSCLLTSNSPQQTTWFFHGEAVSLEVQLPARVRTSNTVVIRQWVLDGLGVSILPDWLVDADIQSGKLVWLLQSWKVSVGSRDSAVWAAYPTRAFLPIKTRKFIDHIRTSLASQHVSDPQQTSTGGC